MIRNVVFDMGMVLMDYHPLAACRAVAPDEAGAQALNAALFSHPEWIKVDEGGIELSELGRHAKARLADPALRPLIDALLDGMPENILAPIPGMGEVVESLLAGASAIPAVQRGHAGQPPSRDHPAYRAFQRGPFLRGRTDHQTRRGHLPPPHRALRACAGRVPGYRR